MHRVFNKGAPFRTGSGSLRSMNVVCVSPLYHFPNCSFFLVKISKVSLSKMLGSTLVIYSSPFLVEIRVLSSVMKAPGWHLFACHLGLTIGFPSWVAVVIEDLVHLGGTCRAFLNWPKCIDFYPSVGFGHQVVCWNGSRSQTEFRHTSMLVLGRRYKSGHTTCSWKLGAVPALSWGLWTSLRRRGLPKTGTTAVSRRVGPLPVGSVARGWRTFGGGCKCCISWSGWWWRHYLQM